MRIIISLFIFIQLQGCKPGQNAASSLSIIGGGDADSEQLNPLISIGSCSGVLIGQRTIATAAHCVQIFSGVQAGEIRPQFSSGRAITLSYGHVSESTKRVESSIEKTLIHPSWELVCTKTSPCDPKRAAAAKKPDVADLALIILKTPVTQISPALVDFSPVNVGDRVIVGGFGCDTGINVGTSGRKKVYRAQVGDGATLLAHQGSERANAIPQTLAANFVTPGGPGNGSLCPGDSGGPVFREGNGRLQWVGVNADYTFTDQYERVGSVPATNIHTRIDVTGVQSWIKANALDINRDPGVTDQKITLALTLDNLNDLNRVRINVSSATDGKMASFCPSDCGIDKTKNIELTQKTARDGRFFFTDGQIHNVATGDYMIVVVDERGQIVERVKKRISR